MVKKILVICVLITLTITQAKAFDFYAPNNDGVRIYYDFQGGVGNRVIVTAREGIFPTYSGVINIPDYVTYEGVKYAVETIGEGAFYGCTELTEVILPPTMKTFRERAFDGCNKLKKINFPDGVTSIRYRAFSDCSSLKNVSLGANLTEIDMYAFINCSALESVTFGNKLSRIDYCAFSGCNELKSVILPESVAEIGDFAFSSTGLTSITIPNGVKTIGSRAFSYCNNLEQVIIGDNVSFIGRSAFIHCNSLKRFVVSGQNNKYSDEDGVLVSKDKTILIIFPAGKSTSEIPSSVKIIGEAAFAGGDFSEIIIPANIDSIGPAAFYSCRNLEKVVFSENLRSIADSAFHEASLLEYITIPDNVISIGKDAFSGCRSLIGVVIGMNVKEIGKDAFYGTSVRSLYNRNPVPQVVKENLGLYYVKLHVPNGSLDLYKNASYWGDFYFYEITEDEYDESIVENENVVKENIIIVGTSNGISVSSNSPATVTVYSMSGQMVYQQHLRDRLDIQLQRGIYIIKAGNVTKKAYVK